MAGTVAALALAAALTAAGDAEPPPTRSRAGSEIVQLEFREVLQPGPKAEPSEKVRGLQGKRVRMIGFMAHMEDAPRGAFYLVSRPLHCAEDGAGTGDLPPDAVRVVVRSSAGEEIPFYPGLLEISGLLQLGHEADEEGRTSFYRIVLDRPEDLAKPHAPGRKS